MLERTAGCFENAGRRFLRDTNSSIRNRTSLRTKLGQDGGSLPDNSRWSAPARRTLRRHGSGTTASRKTSGLASDSRPPLLEFLYPGRTQEFVITRLLRPPRSLFSRRQRRGGVIASRSFVSQTSVHQQEVAVQQPADSQEPQTNWAKDSLIEVLDEGILRQSERAWQLYLLAGRPPDLNSALLAQFCKVRGRSGHIRAKQLFESISETSRSTEDYWNIANSFIAVKQSAELGRICREGAANGHGPSLGSLALARSINYSEWPVAQNVWENLREVDEGELWEHLIPKLDASSLQPKLLNLALLLQRRAKGTAESSSPNGSVPGFARFIFDRVLTSSEFVETFRLDPLLLLLERLNSAAVLTPNHLFGIIEMFQSSEKRSTFVQSILIYRNFHSLVETKVPPAKLLERFLQQLASFNMTAGVDYFLHEFSRFHRRPSREAYRHALSALSQTGEPSSVETIFNEFVASYGKPSFQGFVTPLLYVHARVGNVKDTLIQFERISNEFGLEPNHICWNIVLTAYANAGNFTECFSHFKLMLENGVRVTSHTFGILMGLCAKRGDTQTVYQLLEMAQQHSVRITTSMLDPIVEAHCNNQNFEEAEGFAESCLELDVKGSRVRMWNILLRTYAYRLDVESISRVRSRMDAADIRPDEMTYAALMLSLVLLGQTDAARRILRTLHRGSQMRVTQFHYAIIIYGYFRDRNRAMVQVIFEEMKKRFKDAGLTAQLLLLRDQLQLDLRIDKEKNSAAPDAFKARAELPIDPMRRTEPFPDLQFAHAEETLAKIISEFDLTKQRAKQPAPGGGKQPVAQAFPAMFYDSMAREYAKKGSFRKVEQLIEEYGKTQGLSHEDALDSAPLRLHAALMHAYSNSNQHEKLLACWEIAFRRARRLGRRTTELAIPSFNAHEPPRPVLPNRHDEEFHSILANSEPQESPVLPAYRFVLSRHFSLYIRSLAYTKQKDRIDDAVTVLEKAGFSMTTYNWTTYVQLFSLSDDPTDQLRAFSLFEENFMPNFPGWKYLRRGKALAHSGASPAIRMLERPEGRPPPSILGPIGRKYWSQHHPDILQPTYITMVFLASALLRIRRDSIITGHMHLVEMHKAAPKTLMALNQMPWLREKWQGILLRGYEKLPVEAPSLPKKKRFVWSGGILGVGGRLRKLKRAETYGYTSPQDTQSGDANETEALSIVLPSTSDIETFGPNEHWLDDTSALSFIRPSITESKSAELDENLPESVSSAALPSIQDTESLDTNDVSAHAEIDSSTVPPSTPPIERAIDPEDEFDQKVESLLSRRHNETRTHEFMDDPSRLVVSVDPDALAEDAISEEEYEYWPDEMPVEREVREHIPDEPGQHGLVPDEPVPDVSDGHGQSAHPDDENPHKV